ncbi:magnesium transporter MgtC [bacterium]|nr:magnesium transporter MgtC [bacterium]|tara:strand:- start:13000 stop:13488 length:489 start_codon:yes stop_codon:yes gene_type:complete
MLTLDDMVIRLAVAIILGAIVGVEREMVGKEAGVRTDIVVAAGAAIFTMIGLSLPYTLSLSPGLAERVVVENSGYLRIIANIVVGIGFLGAGIIIHQGPRVRGLTTAASVWFVAAIGVLAGIGLIAFAVISTIGMTALLIILRKMDLYSIVGRKKKKKGKKK